MVSKVVSLFTILCLQVIVAPPVTKDKPQAEKEKEPIEDVMEYHRYLKEVVSALESDPEFRKKLEQANEEDIRSGKIANQLEFVSHHVRTKLDEIKRTEMERLRNLVEKKNGLAEGNYIEDPNHGRLDHLDHSSHTFEIEDLKKLIAKTTEDLAKADRKRREDFKKYEMQKELEKMEKLNHTTGEEREKLEKQYKELEEKHKKHEPLHEPGHKAQLEEVWEKQDHMEQEFDPKTFFMLHDLDSNGLWDENEVKALFVKELDKMYAAGAPEDDMAERIEEMERMRETVFRDVDKNHDNFIDFNEFVSQTKDPNFQEDHGWQPLDENKPYTAEELQEYINQYQMQHGGYYPNQPGYANYPYQQGYPNELPPQVHQMPPQQGYPAPPQGYPNQPHPQGYPNQAQPQGYPNQAPQGYPNQAPPQGYPNNAPQGYPNQAPPQGYPNQAPPQGYPNQVPPQGYPNQAPSQGYPNQAPPQGYPNQPVAPGSNNQAPSAVSPPNQPPVQGNPNVGQQAPAQSQQQSSSQPGQAPPVGKGTGDLNSNSVNLNQPEGGSQQQHHN
ncbi:nucleobindin-2 [Agrilus planipennis]|uniref:Nucleobindin-2 n=1 Tax=Agrilus planipennis TaxID=224129 RepID=A0A1W4WS33_AGRPL|nr:nucleobindin-2 [Agrilus planipennis]XP_018323021.1 nucleobindin-2 [Agrilus planipennis]XP_018323090.1 nucleobindin-2 [Agrilus planipennis]XP_018323165.1 nucleobindin-2 [Agrilus planipennis]